MAFTKSDKQFLKDNFASKDDITNLRSGVNIALGLLKDHIDRQFSKAFRLLPTKQEFFTRMDKLSGEIQKVRVEQTIHSGVHDRNDNRLSRVEKKLNLPAIAD